MRLEGRTQQDVKLWLEQEHNLTVSASAVFRFSKRHRQEKASMAAAIYADEILKSAVSDIEILSENTLILRRIRDIAVETKNPSTVIRACNELKAHVALKMGIAGVDAREATFEETREELIDLIMKKPEDKKGSN